MAIIILQLHHSTIDYSQQDVWSTSSKMTTFFIHFGRILVSPRHRSPTLILETDTNSFPFSRTANGLATNQYPPISSFTLVYSTLFTCSVPTIIVRTTAAAATDYCIHHLLVFERLSSSLVVKVSLPPTIDAHAISYIAYRPYINIEHKIFKEQISVNNL